MSKNGCVLPNILIISAHRFTGHSVKRLVLSAKPQTNGSRYHAQKSVKVYVGLGGYRAGISKREAKLGADAEWGTSRTNLKRQLLYLRSQNSCGGFMLFSYSDLIRKSARSEMKRFTKLLKTVPSNAVGPTATPTAAPTTVPTAVPTGTPTDAPTDSSTTAPTETPAAAPTN